MPRLIDANALKKLIAKHVYPVADAFNSRDYGMFWTGGIEKAIDDAPTVDAEPVRHGRWIYKEHRTTKGDAVGYYICSECGHANWIKEDNYCSLCGAKMQEVEDG